MSANTTPDATATPRTIEQAAQKCLTNLECNNYGFTEACTIIASAMREAVERELSSAQAALTAAKAEIARLNECLTAYNFGDVPKGWDDAIARAERAEAELALAKDDATHQVSVIAKLDADNAQLRAEVEQERTEGESLASQVSAMSKANDQLRARVAELEASLNRVAAQRPSKPDYWNSCGQCESNSDDAKELLDAARAGKGAT